MDFRKAEDEQQILTFLGQYGKIKSSYKDVSKVSDFC